MTAKQLKRLRRSDLLEMLLELSKENEELTQMLEQAHMQLNDKRLAIENSQSLAEASLKVNGLMEATQEACRQYEANVHQQCEKFEEDVHKRCEEYERVVYQRCEKQKRDTLEICNALLKKTGEQIEDFPWVKELL